MTSACAEVHGVDVHGIKCIGLLALNLVFGHNDVFKKRTPMIQDQHFYSSVTIFTL